MLILASRNRLFKCRDANGRGVRLTPAGEALVGYAERVMVVLDEAKSEMTQLRREIAGELRVPAFPSITSAVLPQTVTALRRLFLACRSFLMKWSRPNFRHEPVKLRQANSLPGSRKSLALELRRKAPCGSTRLRHSQSLWQLIGRRASFVLP
ncbi:hypothetical protein CBM2623_B30088 [Cupriavidus taiwanensis]|nr:hypothetical protein CBM2608_B30087 [Cupriavidus taiwanensis]SPA34441.1 hypothetical protein CBM2623_B30088 [Cupriavidus taiwanensis]